MEEGRGEEMRAEGERRGYKDEAREKEENAMPVVCEVGLWCVRWGCGV